MCGPPAGRQIVDPAETAEAATDCRREREQRTAYRAHGFQVLRLWNLSGCFHSLLLANIPSRFWVRRYYELATPVTSDEESDSEGPTAWHRWPRCVSESGLTVDLTTVPFTLDSGATTPLVGSQSAADNVWAAILARWHSDSTPSTSDA
eukprot:GHVU01089310.1.p1 GENE.GHVU01089310.1~~GHVU01089310.1.p1  ORF type:complete len:149 (+),score=9.95 GHVU01089310.1:763-1209(+)